MTPRRHNTSVRSEPWAALVITCSARADRGIYDVTSGSMLVAALRAWGFTVRREPSWRRRPGGGGSARGIAQRPDLIGLGCP